MKLLIRVLDAADCSPLVDDTFVDLWHCDALGLYSAFTNSQNKAPSGSTFLRGLQPVNASGWAEFHTIFPGWYTGRTTHIHFKVRTGGSQGTVRRTAQLFIRDEITEQVNALAPYSTNTGGSRIDMEDDGIYDGYGIVEFQKMDEGAGWAGGIVGTVTLPIDLTAASTSGAVGSGANPTVIALAILLVAALAGLAFVGLAVYRWRRNQKMLRSLENATVLHEAVAL